MEAVVDKVYTVEIEEGEAVFQLAATNVALMILDKMSEAIETAKKGNEMENDFISTMYLMYHNIGVSHLQDTQKAIKLGLTADEYSKFENLEEIETYLEKNK